MKDMERAFKVVGTVKGGKGGTFRFEDKKPAYSNYGILLAFKNKDGAETGLKEVPVETFIDLVKKGKVDRFDFSSEDNTVYRDYESMGMTSLDEVLKTEPQMTHLSYDFLQRTMRKGRIDSTQKSRLVVVIKRMYLQYTRFVVYGDTPGAVMSFAMNFEKEIVATGGRFVELEVDMHYAMHTAWLTRNMDKILEEYDVLYDESYLNRHLEACSGSLAQASHLTPESIQRVKQVIDRYKQHNADIIKKMVSDNVLG